MVVQLEDVNKRIDKYLSDNTDYSRSLIKKMIDDGFIKVNNKNVKCSYKLEENDVIDIDDSYIKEVKVEAEDIKLDIVYEDDDLMIINKPSGMVVHPGNGNSSHTLVNALMGYTNNLSDGSSEFRPGIVHRIDKDTSGLMVVAKNNKAHELLADAFKNKEINRYYTALLIGRLDSDNVLIDAPIGRDPNERKRYTVTKVNSKNAITHLNVIKRFKKYTLVNLKLDTGRTHQIRVHMKYIGYPVYNDPVYTNMKCTDFGQFLHSREIDFIHPITGKRLHFEVDLPKEFQDFIDELANNEDN